MMVAGVLRVVQRGVVNWGFFPYCSAVAVRSTVRGELDGGGVAYEP
jgi:hypothetical protein